MSDIYNPPHIPDYHSVECPECGRARGTACGSPDGHWNCGARIWVVRGIRLIEAIKQPEPPSSSPSRDDYAAGWNDAIDAIVERLQGPKR